MNILNDSICYERDQTSHKHCQGQQETADSKHDFAQAGLTQFRPFMGKVTLEVAVEALICACLVANDGVFATLGAFER